MNKSGRLSQVRAMIKLKQQEEIIESSIELFLKTMKVDFDVLQDILQTRRTNETLKYFIFLWIKIHKNVFEQQETLSCELINYFNFRKKLTDPLRNFMSGIASDFDTVDKMINQFNKCGLIGI